MTRSEASYTRHRISRWTAFLGAAGLASTFATSAQADMKYEVIKGDQGSCSVIFEPRSKTSDDAPLLVAKYKTSGKKGLVSIEATRDGDWEQLQIVHQNQRDKFSGVFDVKPKNLESEPLWTILQGDGDDAVLFHLTGRDGNDEFHSASYTNLTTTGITAALANECGAKGGPFQPSEIGSLEEEEALELKPRDIRHIRWVLNQKYSNAEDVGLGDFTGRERDMLVEYASSNGHEPTRYLNKAIAEQLLEEKFKPKRKDLRGEPGFKRFDDWISYDDSEDGTCAIVSFAKSTKGFKTYTVPRMEIHADPSARGNSLYFDFVTPNRFNNDFPITATVDGRKIRLNIEDGRVRPVDLRSGFASADIVRAIRRGKEVVIRGTGKNEKAKHVVRFSALGFTAAFNKMAYDCDRPRIREWLR
ncbi:hypothetical protein [Aliiroseovarius pelagivivens]|nr:hypothetical protein [Aliiroseovarius pelagivivens]